MIRTKKLVPRIGYVPGDKMSSPLTWEYGYAGRDLQVGDVVEFLCNGRGRGGHVCVHAKVTKVNRKTFKATELPRSYSPGTLWNVNIAYALEPGNGGITIDLSWKE
jgi:hypothetical protein